MENDSLSSLEGRPDERLSRDSVDHEDPLKGEKKVDTMRKNIETSILIPVFNRKNFIAECIRSALAQTKEDIEVVVVDNASTDGTWEIVQNIAKEDDRVKCFQNFANLGPLKNWQRCIDQAKGKYAKILFSDDLVDASFLSKAIPLLAAKDVGFVFTQARIGSDPADSTRNYCFRSRTGLYSSRDFIESALFLGDVPVSPGCALFRLVDLRRNLVEDIPSPTISDFPMHGAGPDLLIYLLTAHQYKKIGYLDEALSFFRSHGDSISIKTKLEYIQKCYTQAKAWFAETYLNRRDRQQFFALTWWEICRSQTKFISPKAVASLFSRTEVRFRPSLLVWVFVNRILKEISRKLRL